MMDLLGSTALITGGARRIGQAIARHLAGRGVNLVLHYNRSEREASALASELGAGSISTWTVQADLDQPAELSGLMNRARRVAGDIHHLVNNASIFPPGRVMDVELAELERNVRVNAWAPLVLTRHLVEAGAARAVVNLLDTRVTGFDHQHAAYHLSKQMLHSLTRTLALELAPAVRVNAVAPGLILPPPGEDESYLQRMRTTNPLQAVGDPAEVAEAVGFLLASDFVTGQTLFVDGGRHLHNASPQ